jgi:putative endonuclease
VPRRKSAIAAEPGSPVERATGWGCYLLTCADGTLYAGATNDLARRVAAHQAGRAARYTRSRLPVVPVYWAACAGRSEALRAEAALKRLTRAEKLALAGASGAAVARRAAAAEGSRGSRAVRPPGLSRPRKIT